MDKRIIKYLFALAGLSLLNACAVQSSPDGGSKDTTPPEIVESNPPNRSTNFTGQTIEITFDEYVKVDGFNSQFISSPPLKYKVEHKLRGKTLRIVVADTLRPNTTYTFSFGNAIKDITENNAQTSFKYVFSTGDVLDSNEVHGQVSDAYSNEPRPNIMVAMYAADSEDSVFMNDVPYYYGITDASGHFDIENVAPGEYKIFAVQDNDFDYTWSGPSERMAFVDETIYADSNPVVDFELFKVPAEYRFYRGKLLEFGKIEMYFSVPAQDVQIERIDTVGSTQFTEFPKNGDTIYLYTNYWEEGGEGLWSLYHEPTSSLDTMSVRFFRKDSTRIRLQLESKASISPADSIIVACNSPILALERSKVAVFLNDTVPVDFEIRQSAPKHLSLLVNAKYGDRFTWILDSGAVQDLHGRWNDSTHFKFNILQDNELSIFHLTVQSDSSSTKVIEIYNDKDIVVYRSSFTDQVNIDLFDILPQKFKARVIYDRNANGHWDSGNYFLNRQPEHVIYLDKAIDLRANWEIDERWIIP